LRIEPIGYVVGETTADRFLFVTTPEICPPRLEYVVIRGVKEQVAGETREVEVLAQVSKLQTSSSVFASDLTYQETETLLKARLRSAPQIIATTTVLGFLDQEDKVFLPRSTPLPGDPVYIAPDNLLERFFTKNIIDGIEIGTLINRPQVKVKIDPNGLRRHLAIIAQTGAGKSFLAGILLENLLQLGAPIIVFDPNSDYVYMRRDKTNRPTPFADRVLVYRVPNIKGRRFSDEEIGGSNPYTIQFSKLEVDEICNLAGIREYATNVIDSVKKACLELEEEGTDYTPKELVKKLKEYANLEENNFLLEHTQRFLEEKEEILPELNLKKKKPEVSQGVRSGAEKAIKHIENLLNFDVWGFRDVPIEELIKPEKLSVIDLAGLERSVSQFVVDKTLREIWTLATTGKLSYPLFIVLEEAHSFIPQESQRSYSANIINRIAAEGRKFKVFLIIITQRPHKVHQDSLSQCGSQIIMKLTNPEDQEAVKMAAENLSADLFSDLPGLNIGEAILLGNLTKVPVMIKYGKRISKEGGSDIDVVEALKAAKRAGKIEPPQEFRYRVEPEEAL